MSEKKVLGINGVGRIGKLTLWHHIGRKYFDEIVINIGRQVGNSLTDIAHYIERDSTYGSLQHFLYGIKGRPTISDINEEKGTMMIDEIRVTFLREQRNPKDIPWANHNAKLVIDTTGQFLDPTMPADAPKGSLRGHLEAGAQKVIVSAPFKIKGGGEMPEDAVTTVMGINEHDYDPQKHVMISNASCTTTCLAHMVKPILNQYGVSRILTASMATVHAVTSSQAVLDKLPKAGATDLRKARSMVDNIILTTTGAAKALGLVIPDMKKVGFMAQSVRIPTSTGSLVILAINLREMPDQPIRRDDINKIYEQAAIAETRGYLDCSYAQNVSTDIIGSPRAAAIIEARETHTRTAEITIDLCEIPGMDECVLKQCNAHVWKVPITQVVIYGWYDNEYGSYVNTLGDRTVSIAENL